MASNYFDNLKGSDWINLANVGTNIIGGLASGKASERLATESAADYQLRLQQ